MIMEQEREQPRRPNCSCLGGRLPRASALDALDLLDHGCPLPIPARLRLSEPTANLLLSSEYVLTATMTGISLQTYWWCWATGLGGFFLSQDVPVPASVTVNLLTSTVKGWFLEPAHCPQAGDTTSALTACAQNPSIAGYQVYNPGAEPRTCRCDPKQNRKKAVQGKGDCRGLRDLLCSGPWFKSPLCTAPQHYQEGLLNCGPNHYSCPLPNFNSVWFFAFLSPPSQPDKFWSALHPLFNRVFLPQSSGAVS